MDKECGVEPDDAGISVKSVLGDGEDVSVKSVPDQSEEVFVQESQGASAASDVHIGAEEVSVEGSLLDHEAPGSPCNFAAFQVSDVSGHAEGAVIGETEARDKSLLGLEIGETEAFSSSSAMLGSAERICPFYLRGRCQRENCDFKHDPEKLKAAKAELAAAKKRADQKDKTAAAANEGSAAPAAVPVMAFKSPTPNAPSKNNAPSIMSADSIAGGSGFDDESIVSGFTDMTTVNKAPAAQAAKAKETATAKAAAPDVDDIVEAEEANAIAEGATEEEGETLGDATIGANVTEEGAAIGEGWKGSVTVAEGETVSDAAIGAYETGEGATIGEGWKAAVTVAEGETVSDAAIGANETGEGATIGEGWKGAVTVAEGETVGDAAIGLGANVEVVRNIIVPVAPASSANELFEVSLPDCAGLESGQLILYDNLIRQLGLESGTTGVFGDIPAPTAGGPLQQISYLPVFDQVHNNMIVSKQSLLLFFKLR